MRTERTTLHLRILAVAGSMMTVCPLAHAQSEMPPELIEAAKRPGGDALLRAAKAEDSRQVARLNVAQARSTAARDRALVGRRDAANDTAAAQYRAEMAEWRRRVAACQDGDWGQCDR